MKRSRKPIARMVALFSPDIATRVLGLKPVAGGENLDALLKAVDERLATIQKDRDEGKQVDESRETILKEERARIVKELEDAVAGAGEGGKSSDGLPSYSELLAYKQTKDLEDAAGQVAGLVQKQVESAQSAVQGQLEAAVQKQLKDAGIDGDENPLVKAALDQVIGKRGSSRAVLPGADPSLVERVAKGGGIDVEEKARVIGAPEASEIRESKSFVRAYSAALNVKAGMATDGEMEFYREARQKALALGTDSAGGFMVPTEFMAEVQQLLLPYTTVRRAGVQELPFDRSLTQHVLSGEPTAYYTLENAHITPSEPTFADVPRLSPRELTAFVPVSNRLLRSAPQAEGIVRDSMARVLGLREDLAFLQGTGGAEPVGFRNMAGITANPIALTGGNANGFYPSLMDLRKIRARLRRLNPINPRPVWIFHIDLLTNLEVLTDTLGRPLLESAVLSVNADGVSGSIDGTPFFTTTQIPTNITTGTDVNTTYALLVNLDEALIGLGQDMEIEASSEASYTPDGGTTHVHMFQARQTGFRATMIHDIDHKRKSQVIIQYGIKLPA